MYQIILTVECNCKCFEYQIGTINIKKPSLAGVVQEQKNIESVKVMWSVVKRFSEDLDPLDNKQLKFQNESLKIVECCDHFVSTCKCSFILYQILYIELFYVTANGVVGNVLYRVILYLSLSL